MPPPKKWVSFVHLQFLTAVRHHEIWSVKNAETDPSRQRLAY
nr:MAG TPA: hypothetical protein [Caudoviricetes sp.]